VCYICGEQIFQERYIKEGKKVSSIRNLKQCVEDRIFPRTSNFKIFYKLVAMTSFILDQKRISLSISRALILLVFILIT
jgi:hypothetical protein